MIGQTKRSLYLSLNPKEAFKLLQQTGEKVGSVQNANQTLNTLKISTRYGLQHISLTIDVIPADGGATVNILAAGDDLWGGGARKAIEKFVKVLEDVA